MADSTDRPSDAAQATSGCLIGVLLMFILVGIVLTVRGSIDRGWKTPEEIRHEQLIERLDKIADALNRQQEPKP